jgi:4-amino-4-deoxy-L-arabinose transferase-like glycosyltransferase
MNALAFVQGQGLGYGTPLQHPFYTFFVGILHVLFGQDYPAIFRAHAVVYALFPVLLYLLAKDLGNRPTGILAALLVVFHDYNLIIYGSTYTLVNAQMMVSEAFITLLFGLLIWITFKWIDKPGMVGGPLISGAVLGLAALVRTQALILLAVYLLYFILRWLGDKHYSFRPFLMLVSGLLIVLLPWMTRNWVKSGSFTMEDMRYVTNILTVNGTVNRTTEASIILYNENHQVDLIKSFTGPAGARYFRRVVYFSCTAPFIHFTNCLFR